MSLTKNIIRKASKSVGCISLVMDELCFSRGVSYPDGCFIWTKDTFFHLYSIIRILGIRYFTTEVYIIGDET